MYRHPDTNADADHEKPSVVSLLLTPCRLHVHCQRKHSQSNYWTADKVLPSLSSFVLGHGQRHHVVRSDESYGFLSNSTLHNSPEMIFTSTAACSGSGRLMMSYQYIIMYRRSSQEEFGKGYGHRALPVLLKSVILKLRCRRQQLCGRLMKVERLGGSVDQQGEEWIPSWDQGADSLSAPRRRTSTSFGNAVASVFKGEHGERRTLDSRNVAKDDSFLHGVGSVQRLRH